MDLLSQLRKDPVLIKMLKDMHSIAVTIGREAFTNIVYGDRTDKPNCVCSLKFGDHITFGNTHSVRSSRSSRGRIGTVHTHNGHSPQPPSTDDLAINLEQSNNEPETYVPTIVVDESGVWFLYVLRAFDDSVADDEKIATAVCEKYDHMLKSNQSASRLTNYLQNFGIMLEFIPFDSYL